MLLQVLLDAFRQRSLISGYGHNNLNTIACNLINLSQDLGGCIHVVVNDFQDAVNEQFGDIIVTSQNTSNKTVQHISAVDVVFIGVQQAGCVVNLGGKFLGLLITTMLPEVVLVRC